MPTQASVDQRISVNISFVVVVYEIVGQRLSENNPNQNNDDAANGKQR